MCLSVEFSQDVKEARRGEPGTRTGPFCGSSPSSGPGSVSRYGSNCGDGWSHCAVEENACRLPLALETTLVKALLWDYHTRSCSKVEILWADNLFHASVIRDPLAYGAEEKNGWSGPVYRGKESCLSSMRRIEMGVGRRHTMPPLSWGVPKRWRVILKTRDPTDTGSGCLLEPPPPPGVWSWGGGVGRRSHPGKSVTEGPQLSRSGPQSPSKKQLLREYVEKIILHPIEITLFKKWMKIVDKSSC